MTPPLTSKLWTIFLALFISMNFISLSSAEEYTWESETKSPSESSRWAAFIGWFGDAQKVIKNTSKETLAKAIELKDEVMRHINKHKEGEDVDFYVDVETSENSMTSRYVKKIPEPLAEELGMDTHLELAEFKVVYKDGIHLHD